MPYMPKAAPPGFLKKVAPEPSSDPADYPPMKVRPASFYNFANEELYDISQIAADITANQNVFSFGYVRLSILFAQIEGQGNIDPAYVAGLTEEDAKRPIIMVRYDNQESRIVDGYHRAARARQLGFEFVAAWVVEPQDRRRYLRPLIPKAKI